jgi:Xaa-Pro aminopeptidase
LADESVKTDPKFIKFYTTVLKGLLRLQNATFPVGISGSVIDGITREPLYAQGMEFKHGTGHGVGIHVHEPGVRISTVSNVPMAAGQVVSLEPGFYEPGFGGVRLENIAIVEEHPDYEGFLRFKNMVWIGFEPALIDESLLNTQEKTWLDEYEAECSKRGTSFR